VGTKIANSRADPFALAGPSRTPRLACAPSTPSGAVAVRGGRRSEKHSLPRMEGRSGAVVVLATGIDPSPLVLPPLPSSSRSLARPLLLRLRPLLLPSRAPLHPRVRPPPSHSLMHSETRTQTHAAGYARIRYMFTRECRSFLSLASMIP